MKTSERTGQIIKGSHPNILIKGRPLREWVAEDTGETTAEMLEWKTLVENATGVAFETAVGAALDIAFDCRLHRLAADEQFKATSEEFLEGARSLGFKNPGVLSLVEIRGADGEPDRRFAVISDGDAKIVVGIEDYRWQQFDVATLVEMIERSR